MREFRGYDVQESTNLRASPGSRVNLDHLAFTASGAPYVDTKNWLSDTSQVCIFDASRFVGEHAEHAQ